MNQQFLTKRNAEICEAYRAGKTDEEISAAYGISVSRLKQILKGAGVSRRATPKRRKKMIETKPISSFHAQIGSDITYRRNKLNMTPQEFALAAGMTKERLRAIEMGVKEPTLTDLARLAKVAGVELSVLMTPRNASSVAGAA